jgi:hypothetical protein
MLTLAQAAALTGHDRSRLSRAIERGAIAGAWQDDGSWLVDPAELSRLYSTRAMQQDARAVRIAALVVEAKLLATEACIAHLRNALAVKRRAA